MAPNREKDTDKKFQKSYFDVLGLCCTSEAPLIERILKNLDGVKDVSVIVPTKTVIVLHDTLLISQLQIAKALNQARLEASVRVQGVKNYQKRWPSPYAVACGVLLLLSFLKFVYHPFQWLALGAVAIGIIPILLRALTALRNLTLADINFLVLITVAASIALNDYWEAGTIVFLFSIAEWLQSRASHKATAAMSSLLNLVPERAVLAETGEEVNADEVKVNTILAVKDGEIIPIDGVVVEGNCEVDEKNLTGESFPVSKQTDSNVWAGTVNVNGYISIKTTALAEDCVVARMTKLVEEAQNKKSRTQTYIEKCTKYYTPAIVLISACLALVPFVLRVPKKNQWLHLALVVLMSSCPCALILSTPVAMFCALTKAATSGVFFKGADYFETLANVRIMAFDKTGTVTRAEFEVTEFKCLLDDVSLSTMLYWISSIESKSSHPLAAALVAFAQSHSVEAKPDKVEQFQNFPGEGVYGTIDGKEIYVGNLKISSRAGCTLDGNIAEGMSTGYIFLGSIPAGIFYLTDVCRTGAKDALKELKSMGIKTAMLTGDCYAAAKHAQDQLGGALDVVHPELLPEDKARIIMDFQKVSYTAMIGDGLNDALALATADVGISMGISGSALATETGNVILMSNDIRRIPKVARLARRVKWKVIENMFLSISTKCAILALAIAGHPIVWAAVLADVGTCLLVIMNSMLLLRENKGHGGKRSKSSAASHANRNRERCRSELPHMPCCNDTKLQKSCKQPSCSSKNCVPMHQSSTLGPLHQSATKHICCGHGNQVHDSEFSNQGNTKSAAHYLGLKSSGCGLGDQFHESKWPNHGSRKTVVRHFGSQCCCLEHGNQDDVSKHSSTGRCETDVQDLGSKTHHHGEISCCNSCERLGATVIDDEVRGHCNHENHWILPSKDSFTISRNEDSELNSDKQFEVNSCVNDVGNLLVADQKIGDLVRHFCQNDQAKTANSGCRNHAAHLSIIDISGDDNHASCTTANSCTNLGKKQVGACCQSFRKECCIKHGHLEAHFRGGLSEIVIE